MGRDRRHRAPAADNAVGFDVRQLKALLEAPLAYAERVPAKPVWHCSVRAAPTDRLLSDAEWADIARDVVSSVGLGADGKRSGVRWAAVRHAPDHIHIVATLVREDGTPARLDFDKKRCVPRASGSRSGTGCVLRRLRTDPRFLVRAARR